VTGPDTTRTKGFVRVAVALSAAVFVAGIGAFIYAAGFAGHDRQSASKGTDAVHLTLTASTCEPAEVKVPAGPVVFQITNRSERVVEWEILDGVRVVAERENIAPGLTQRLAAQLRPGRYAMTCGLLSNPRGSLVVEKTAANRAVSLVDLVGPMAEYRVFLLDRLGSMREAIETLDDDASAGRAAAAAQALDRVVGSFRQIEPALARSGRQDPLSTPITAAADALGRGDMGSLRTAASALQDGAASLAARWDAEMMMPDVLLEGAVLTLGGGEAGSQQGLPPDTLAGLRKIVDLLGPLLAEIDPPLTATVRTDLAALDRASAEARAGLQDARTAVSRDLGAMRTALRVEGGQAQP
jgi:high-affinity iron transporter